MCNKLVITFVFSYFIIVCAENSNENNQFVPTRDWQVVKEGQSIPKGLHVRINLETGLKEAKLLDTDDDKTEHRNSNNALLQLQEQIQTEEVINKKIHSTDELKIILEKISKAKDHREDLPTLSEDEIKRIKNKFKDYDQLKKDLGDINLSMKTDAELLKKLTENYENIIINNTFSADVKNEEILTILQDIEYLVHQIDNANYFITTGSFDEIIYKNLNNTNIEIKSEVLKILGACVQNNAKVQIYALETGAVEKITRLLALETNDGVKLRAIYSLSSLLRRFPLAQKEFIKNGGLNIFEHIFKTLNNMKLQLKIITLLYDLLIEHKEAMDDIEIVDFKERSKQYMSVDLENNLIRNGWCEIFANLLENNLSIEELDHDAIERCLNIILLIVDNCKQQFSTSKLLTHLDKLKKNYQSLETESDATYFTYLKDLTHNLITIIVHNYKTEL